jgi:hypothetical protein
LSHASDRLAPRHTHSTAKDPALGATEETGEPTHQFVRLLSLLGDGHLTDAYVPSKADSFCWDAAHGLVWGLCADGTLERRVTLLVEAP